MTIKTNEYKFIGYGSADIEVFNYTNFCSKFVKQPDFSFDILPGENRKQPSIVGEVAKTNENFKLLLDEIECYLNEYTHIEYVVAVIFLEQNVFNMRLIVAQRKTPQTFFANDSKECDFRAKKNFENKCNVDQHHQYSLKCNYESSHLIHMSKNEIEDIYNFEIICDETRTQANIDESIKFKIEIAPLLIGTPFASDRDYLQIIICKRILNSILSVFNMHI